MPDVSFAPNATTEETPSAALASRETADSAVVPQDYYDEVDRGGSTSDLEKPYLNLVGKTGELSELFKPGTFVIAREIILGDKDIPLVVLDYRKVWSEYIDMDANPDVKGRMFRTEAAATEAGLTCVDKATHREEGCAVPIALISAWVGKSAAVSPDQADAFSMILPSGAEGKLVAWTVRATTYNTVFKPLYTEENQNASVKKNGIHSRKFALWSTKESWQGKIWYQGRIRPVGNLSAEDTAYLAGYLK